MAEDAGEGAEGAGPAEGGRAKQTETATEPARVQRTRGRKPQLQPQRKDGWTAKKRELFLSELAATANVRGSARAAGMSDQGLYSLRQRDPAFRAAWDAALREGFARLEMMLLERAMNGVAKPVFHGGQAVGEVTEYSDRLAMGLLAHHRGAVIAMAAAEAAEAGKSDDGEAARARLIARFAEINMRLGGDD